MYVSNNSALQSLASLYANDHVKSVKKAQQAEGTSFKDELVLSQEAQSFSDMLSELKTMDEVRQDKVAELGQQMDSGRYRADAGDIADSILKMQF